MDWPLSQKVGDLIVDIVVEEGHSLNHFSLMSRAMLYRIRYASTASRHGTLARVRNFTTPSVPLRIFVPLSKDSSCMDFPMQNVRPSSWKPYAPCFTALKEFHIEDFSCIRLPRKFFSQLSKCIGISKITLHNTVLSSYTDFALIIRAFPNLGDLYLKSVSATVDSESCSSVQDNSVAPTIKTLDINISEEFLLRVSRDIREEADAPAAMIQL
ncbi:uncharacterized protein BT62DRAFT_924906 [Guyanagaster necrorhizus]|uniref:Uncharacterized protein n=1 Tax=Guyanagaster necrorhizus TaxID=856835 RepID=A0A9P7VEI0_9AGAR|nr:uncharacterized protein BT62DRAFT_924906 [Guyanagaster necrorhizus MCA 3950]KAG7439127.1 hypothetical protein BT62DRAFT_924906 [Guyanagaster necrorhizus MCA 3950]